MDIENTIKIMLKGAADHTDVEEIREKLKKANLVISGGIAFSGYNNDFNANDGIYRYTLNREQEINETKKVNMYSDDQCFRGIIVCWMCQETGRKEDRDKQ